MQNSPSDTYDYGQAIAPFMVLGGIGLMLIGIALLPGLFSPAWRSHLIGAFLCLGTGIALVCGGMQ